MGNWVRHFCLWTKLGLECIEREVVLHFLELDVSE